MSLVLEALRRIERPESKPGSVGVAVSSYRRAPKRSSFMPLLLGLIAGAAVVLLFSPALKAPRRAVAEPAPLTAAAPTNAGPVASAGASPPKAGLGPAPSIEPRAVSQGDLPIEPAREAKSGSLPVDPAAAPTRRARQIVAEISRPAFVLQAISERDHHPIAIINDRLVKEGDLLGSARVLLIGDESVTLLLENGKREVVRFAPPPEGSPETF